jgi:hypothetical protein
VRIYGGKTIADYSSYSFKAFFGPSRCDGMLGRLFAKRMLASSGRRRNASAARTAEEGGIL